MRDSILSIGNQRKLAEFVGNKFASQKEFYAFLETQEVREILKNARFIADLDTCTGAVDNWVYGLIRERVAPPEVKINEWKAACVLLSICQRNPDFVYETHSVQKFEDVIFAKSKEILKQCQIKKTTKS